MRKYRIAATSLLATLLLFGTSSAEVYRICGYAVDWEYVQPDGCSCWHEKAKDCELPWVDDIVRGFYNRSIKHGQTGRHFLQNNQVITTMFHEDLYYKGNDYVYADSCEFTMYGGHGGLRGGGEDKDHFWTGSLTSNKGGSCDFYSNQMKLGEKYNKNTWAVPHPGSNKLWAMFACESLELAWIEHWMKNNTIPYSTNGVFQGVHILTGFNDTAYSFFANNEFGNTFADELFSRKHPIEQGWFYANRATWIHNMAVVYAAGLTCQDAEWRLHHEDYSYPYEPFPPTCWYWSWQLGEEP